MSVEQKAIAVKDGNSGHLYTVQSVTYLTVATEHDTLQNLSRYANDIRQGNSSA